MDGGATSTLSVATVESTSDVRYGAGGGVFILAQNCSVPTVPQGGSPLFPRIIPFRSDLGTRAMPERFACEKQEIFSERCHGSMASFACMSHYNTLLCTLNNLFSMGSFKNQVTLVIDFVCCVVLYCVVLCCVLPFFCSVFLMCWVLLFFCIGALCRVVLCCVVLCCVLPFFLDCISVVLFCVVFFSCVLLCFFLVLCCVVFWQVNWQ